MKLIKVKNRIATVEMNWSDATLIYDAITPVSDNSFLHREYKRLVRELGDIRDEIRCNELDIDGAIE